MTSREQKRQKKLQKQRYKLEKKRLELAAEEAHADEQTRSSWYVRFADSTKGILYIILAVSMLVAVVLGETGLIVTLEDIIDSLMLAHLGKLLIGIIAVALLIYGLKNLRILK